MVSYAQAKELIESLVNRGEGLDPRDLTLFYGWVYSSYVALEPFPSEHRRFCRRCLDSFDTPDRKLKTGLVLLKSALGKQEKCLPLAEMTLSSDYLKLLARFLQFSRTPSE